MHILNLNALALLLRNKTPFKTRRKIFCSSLNNHNFFHTTTSMSAKSDDEELEYLQTLADRIRQTMTENVNDSTVQQSDQTGTSKDMARSYGKYEKLKDTPDNLYGMFACILQSDFRL